MKGFGIFIVAIILLASILFAFEDTMNKQIEIREQALANETKMIKFATLRNVLLESYKKTTDHEAWRIASIGIGKSYDTEVFVDQNNLTISSNDLRVIAQYSLMP